MSLNLLLHHKHLSHRIRCTGTSSHTHSQQTHASTHRLSAQPLDDVARTYWKCVRVAACVRRGESPAVCTSPRLSRNSNHPIALTFPMQKHLLPPVFPIVSVSVLIVSVSLQFYCCSCRLPFLSFHWGIWAGSDKLNKGLGKHFICYCR
jgi:hypothetical protein